MMKFDHMCIMVSDLDRALGLWCDVFGFKLLFRKFLPDGDAPGPGVLMHKALLEDIFKVKDARTDTAFLVSEDGALMELQQVETPVLRQTSREILGGYDYTGVQELGLLVEDIDRWFEKIRAAGYQTQTEYVWSVAGLGKSFLFFDDDGNLIQLREGPSPTY